MKGFCNMQNKRDDKDQCYSPDCRHNIPYIKPHYHVITPDGGYVKFIVSKPKSVKEYDDADTRGQWES